MWSDRGADPWVVGVLCSLHLGASTSCGAHPLSVLQPHFHQGQGLGEGSSVSCRESCGRACSFTFSGLLQPDICGDESLGVVETSDRFVNPQSESPQDSLQDGDSPVCASVCAGRRLDGLHRLEGRILAGPITSGQWQVPQICCFESSFSIQNSVFRSLYGSTGFHTGHGSGLSHSASPGNRMCRYLDDWLIQAPSRPLVLQALETVVHLCRDLGVVINWEKSNLLPSRSPCQREVLAEYTNNNNIPSQRVVYLGVILDSTLFRVSPSQPRVEKLCLIIEEFLSCDVQTVSLWRRLLGVLSSLTPIVLRGRLRMRSLQLRLHRLWDQEDDSTLIPWDQDCRQDLEWWIVPGRLQAGISLAQANPHLDFWSDASDVEWGAHLLDTTAISG